DLRLSGGAGAVFLLGVVSATAVGVILLRSRPSHPVGWCFVGLGVSVAVAGAAQGYGSWALFVDGGAPLGEAAAVVASIGFIVWEVLLGLVCALTPDGRALNKRWRWAMKGLVGTGLLWLLSAALMSGPLDQAPFAEVENPWGVTWPGLGLLRIVGSLGMTVLLIACAGSLLLRFRRSRGDERRRLLWMAVGVVPVPAFVVVMFAAAVSGADVLLDVTAGLFVAILPVSAALAITRFHLYDVERVLSRAVTYLLLSLSLAATYVGVVIVVGDGIGGLAGSSTVSVAAATLAAAMVARPLHGLLQDAVDRRFARRRYDALRTVRAHVAAPQPGDDIERVLHEALQDPTLSVAYWVAERGQWVSAEGRQIEPGEGAVTVERAGRMVAAVTAAPSSELLRTVLREAEPALESTGLRAAVALQLQEVRASRARIATAQLRERRRIERDLHDGAQQRLLAMAAQLQAALLNGEAERQREALRVGVEQCRAAVSDLRSLANGLHPAVLTEGGLSAALDDLATRLPVRVHLDDADRRWPPEVEATAWFVACEAVTNAVKHADASSVRVHVSTDARGLVLAVADDGNGGADANGRGLRGLADRVEAVGGQLHVTANGSCGTRVEAVLPCGS
ncbi:MAG: histidine kinase, partial [Ilumatobacteraceae bacterium]